MHIQKTSNIDIYFHPVKFLLIFFGDWNVVLIVVLSCIDCVDAVRTDVNCNSGIVRQFNLGVIKCPVFLVFKETFAMGFGVVL